MTGPKIRGRKRGYPNRGTGQTRGGGARGRGRARGRGGPDYVAIYEDDGDFAIDAHFRMFNLFRHPEATPTA
jgi:hypothetical protein